MKEQRIMRYYLGGNTADGFYSLYDSFVSQRDGDFLWIIKGGAGCGKSSFMKMIGAAAERAGLKTEYVLCSGDPESLDGVFIPALKTAYVDGTAPHAQDTAIAAVDSAYINLGEFYDRAAIAEHKTELEELMAKNKEQYKKTYSLLGAAGSLKRGWLFSLVSSADRAAAISRADGIALREFGKKSKKQGSIKKRFMSANTCMGYLVLPDMSTELCEKIYTFENRYLLGNAVIERLAQKAAEAGHDIVLCPNPLTPELYDGLFVPGLALGFVCSEKKAFNEKAARNIRLDSHVSGAARTELKACEKLIDNLKSEAYATLGNAKRYHDDIEKIYNPHVDFDGVYKIVEKHIAMMGLK